MTKSQIFKSAHKLAKEVLYKFESYAKAFRLALKDIYKKINDSKKTLKYTLEDEKGVISFKYDDDKRYFDNSIIRFNEGSLNTYTDIDNNKFIIKNVELVSK